jgi:hypothetical protein
MSEKAVSTVGLVTLLFTILLLMSAVTEARAQEPAGAVSPEDGRHDFDFLFGRWRVHNRRLVARLQGSTEWKEFEATNEARGLPTGLGNEDVFRSEHLPGFVGMSFRFFDPQSKTWAIHWVDNRVGVLEPPVIGSFSGDVGIFKGPDVFRGRPITVRFIWSGVTTARPRWEQAFSPDGGQTWETNWVMEFTRAEDPR